MADEAKLRRLAQFRPFAHAGSDTRSAVDDLVITAAVESGGSISSLGGCREACKTLWGLDVEIDEIRASVHRLQESGKLESAGGEYRLTEVAHAEIDLTLASSEAIESQAFLDWETDVRRIWPLVDDESVALLRSDLEAWLRQLVTRHGIEAALLLYPEDGQAQEMFAAVEAMGLDFLPKRPKEFEEVREQALSLFIRRPTESQRMLLGNLLHTSYVLTVLTLDPELTEWIRDISAGQRVYLDTNVVYRLLNLQTPRSFLSSKRLIELTQELGYEVAVTPWTVQELRTSLERARSFLKSRPIPPGELAELAAAATTDENFITAYWRRLRDKPVSVDDFFDFYNEIEEHLAHHGVAVVNDGTLAVERDDDAISEQLSIIERVPGPRLKSEPVKLHDVKHRLLIERLRGQSSRRFANAGFWFLTGDSSLPRYDYMAQEGEGQLPFCVTAGAWLQITRSLVPRTVDYDQTLVDLMASPYIRYRGRVAYDTVQEVLGRVELFSGATPELASRLLFNSALLREVAEAHDEEARTELIDNALVQAAAGLERDLEEAKRRMETERGKRLALDHIADELAGDLQRERDAVERLENELRVERRLRADSEDQATADREEEKAAYEYRLGDLENRLSSQTTSMESLKRLLRVVAGSFVAAAAIVVVAALRGSEVVTRPMPFAVLIVAGIFAVVGAIAVAFDRKTASIALGVVVLVVGLLAGVYQLLLN
jgi:hypothetical protein